jgi:proline racemase
MSKRKKEQVMIFSGNWQLPAEGSVIRTLDLHTGGEPLRVLIDGLPEIKGRTILEKRRYFRDYYDHLRTGILWEPRGHADMYGAILTEPTTPDGDFGVFFMHNEGYSTMCGHAMIALATLVLDTGMIRKPGDRPLIKIDAPPGRVTAIGYRDSETGRIKQVSFRNVPSFMTLRDREVEVPGIGRVLFDIGYGGAFYAYCQARPLGLKLDASDYQRLIAYGRRIKAAVQEGFEIKHPFEADLSFLYGTIFTGEPEDPAHHSRNVCIFADGEVDRSATGSGVSGRAAIHFAKGELEQNRSITIESILGSCMEVKVVDTVQYGPYQAVIPEVYGRAWITGRNEFYFDPSDPWKNGFIFR